LKYPQGESNSRFQLGCHRENGDVAQTFLVDGVVAGAWAVADDRVGVSPFAPLPRGVRREVEEKVRRLQAFVPFSGAKPVK